MAETSAPGLLLAMMDIDPEAEGEFNHWYDIEHVPERLAVPGFLGAQRYQAVEGSPKYQALYDLESPAVLDRPEYKKLNENPSELTQRLRPHFRNFHRGVYEQIFPTGQAAAPAPKDVQGVLLVGLSVPPEHEADVHAWYNEEHIPQLAAVPGVLRARRFAPVDGSKQYLAVYELANLEVPSSAEWQKAIDTPWSARQRERYQRWLRILSRVLVPAPA